MDPGHIYATGLLATLTLISNSSPHLGCPGVYCKIMLESCHEQGEIGKKGIYTD